MPTLTASSAVDELMERIRTLSRNDRENLLQIMRDELADDELPARHRRLLEERERLLAEGRTQFAPWEDAKARLDAKWLRK
ncbi:MAG: addiction module protein [Verrucomicrobiaceae bacterium]|nr:addiction module protein [Verrucomicrobiaceae bacterium]